MTVSEIFRSAKLKPPAAVKWEDIPHINEKSSGVYVVSIRKNPESGCGNKTDISRLKRKEQERWLNFQPVIYIGRATELRGRLKAFYRHKYGDKKPHRGGQSRHLVRHIPQWIFFAATKKFEEAKTKMIAAFEKRTGKLPYANRRH